MEKKFSLKTVITVTCVVTVAAITLTAAFFGFVIVPKREGSLHNSYGKLVEINNIVESFYAGEIDNEAINDSLAYGYILGMGDKYAAYISKKDADINLNSLKGYNTGIGVQVSQHPDTKNIYVGEVHKDSPAEKAGIKKGDQIIAIDGLSVKETGYLEVVNYIPTVPLGNTMKVNVLRNGEELLLEVTLAVFATQSVFYEKFHDIGYICITAFNDRTFEQFKSGIDSLLADGVKALVFDLRGNGGGTLTSVCKMVDYIVPEGVITKVDYKVDALDETYTSDSNEVNVPMAILTDESTASASELFAQSLIDYGKAVTIGRKTYGKGVVQSTYSLSDGSLVRFTVAKYYTKNGICVDGIGVSPSIPVEWSNEELNYRIVNGIEVDKDYLAAVEYLTNQLS